MKKTSTVRNAPRDRRKGQTLAEFAISLPVILLLLFGIIEFGRIFQAWVSLQNAARSAARYASTGAIHEDLEEGIDTESTGSDRGINVLIPCLRDTDGPDQRGTLVTDFEITTNVGSVMQVYASDVADPLDVPTDPGSPSISPAGVEALFSTWYSGRDCDPQDEFDQELRKDILRIPSIFEEARRGAAGLALPNTGYVENINSEADLRRFLYATWRPDFPHYRWQDGVLDGSADIPEAGDPELRSYFDVVVCSTRRFIFQSGEATLDSQGYSEEYSPNPNVPAGKAELRFITVTDNRTADFTAQLAPLAPGCILNEEINLSRPGGPYPDNEFARWLDAGGPGDSVTIIVNFHHPLITPLGFAEYLPLQARRTAVNESFRAARAVGALAGGSAASGVPGADSDDSDPGDLGEPPNQAPVGGPDDISLVYTDTGVVGNLLLDDSDADGDSFRITSIEYTAPGGALTTLDLIPGDNVVVLDTGERVTVDSSGNIRIETNGAYSSFTPTVGQPTPAPVNFSYNLEDSRGEPSAAPTLVTITYEEVEDDSLQEQVVDAFDCDAVSILPVNGLPAVFRGETVEITLQNTSAGVGALDSILLHWLDNDPIYANMAVVEMSLNGSVFWQGRDETSTTDSTQSGFIVSADRSIPGGTETAPGLARISIRFAGGPRNLLDVMNVFDLGGTTFSLTDDLGTCNRTLPFNIGTPENPNDTDFPNLTPEPTDDPEELFPDCENFVPQVNPGSPQFFEDFFIVHFQIRNLRTVPAPVVDFDITWQEWRDRAGNSLPLELREVRLRGDFADDPSGTLIWRSASGASGPTVNGQSTGEWLTNETLPPDSSESMWLIFNPISAEDGNLSNNPYNMLITDFNGTSVTTQRTGCEDAGDDGTGQPVTDSGTFDEDLPEINLPPQANDRNYTVDEQVNLSEDFSGAISDPNGDSVTITQIRLPGVSTPIDLPTDGTPITINFDDYPTYDPSGSNPASVGVLTVDNQGNITYISEDIPDGSTPREEFFYTVVDPDGETDEGRIRINVTPDLPPSPPEAQNEVFTVGEGTSTNRTLNYSDPNGDPVVVTQVSLPGIGTPFDVPAGGLTLDLTNFPSYTGAGVGTLTVNQNGSMNYTSTTDLVDGSPNVIETINFTVEDPGGLTDTAQIIVTVEPDEPDQPPTGVNDTRTITYPTNTVSLNALNNDDDPDGSDSNMTIADAGTFNYNVSGASATFVVNSNGSVNFTYNGSTPSSRVTYTHTYTVRDEQGLTDTATITVHVDPEPTDDPPNLDDDTISRVVGSTTNITEILNGDTDDNTNVNTSDMTIIVQDRFGSNVTLTPSSSCVAGSCAFTDAGQVYLGTDGQIKLVAESSTGTETFTYQLNDGGNTSSAATVTVNLTTSGGGSGCTGGADSGC